jgi:hypothetical protein
MVGNQANFAWVRLLPMSQMLATNKQLISKNGFYLAQPSLPR